MMKVLIVMVIKQRLVVQMLSQVLEVLQAHRQLLQAQLIVNRLPAVIQVLKLTLTLVIFSTLKTERQ